MKALVVYDSVFGNTEKVAQAIGGALGTKAEVLVIRVGDAKPEHLIRLCALIVGSPTRAFSATPAIKKWLNGIETASLNGVKVAAFDTRVSVEDVNSGILSFLVKIFGYAAEPTTSKLVKKGGDLSMPPEGFIVKGTEGPLKDGELERAADWMRPILQKQ